MTATPPSEWKCDCGAWVPIGYSRHVHYTTREPTIAEMVNARAVGRDKHALVQVSEETGSVWRNNKHEVR